MATHVIKNLEGKLLTIKSSKKEAQAYMKEKALTEYMVDIVENGTVSTFNVKLK